MTRKARTVAEVIAAEAQARNGRAVQVADMMAIANVINNRARQLGVTPTQVVQNTNEFNAYNKDMKGTEVYVDLARNIMDAVTYGRAGTDPTNGATFYARQDAVANLVGSAKDAHFLETYSLAPYGGHVYFEDQNRAKIGTSIGYKPRHYQPGAPVPSRIDFSAAGKRTIIGPASVPEIPRPRPAPPASVEPPVPLPRRRPDRASLQPGFAPSRGSPFAAGDNPNLTEQSRLIREAKSDPALAAHVRALIRSAGQKPGLFGL